MLNCVTSPLLKEKKEYLENTHLAKLGDFTALIRPSCLVFCFFYSRVIVWIVQTFEAKSTIRINKAHYF